MGGLLTKSYKYMYSGKKNMGGLLIKSYKYMYSGKKNWVVS